MLSWLSANVGNIVIIAALVTIVTLIIVSMVRGKRQGKSSCGGDCSACHGGCGGHCHE